MNVTHEKLIVISKTIIDAIKYAKQHKDIELCNAAWVELEMEWFDWLKDMLIDEDNQKPEFPKDRIEYPS